MKATELIAHLKEAVELYGDQEVWVDCTLEGLSTTASGVYKDIVNNVIRIGDKDYQEETQNFIEENPDCGYEIVLVKDVE